MMKKITRIAALLATTALLLAGFPACGDDDGDEDPTLTGISIDTGNAITDYKVGDKFDTTAITVVATYSDGVTQDVTKDAELAATIVDDNNKVKPFTTETAGYYEVTLTAKYGGETGKATLTITVKDEQDEPPTLTSIEVTVADTVKTEYTVGEEFDKTGITVTATYSNGDTKDETANATITAKVGDAEISALEKGDYDVTITATYEGQTATATRTITVKADDGEQGEKPTLTNIKVTFAETVKTEYKAGEKFDKTGITVTATYSNGDTKDETANATITAKVGNADFTTATAGTFDVTITATYGGKTATATCKITVKDDGGKPVETPTLTGLKVTTADTLKTEYKAGEAFDKAGITVTATYSNDKTEDVTAKATITAKSGDTEISALEEGEHEVTITATYEGQTATATCKITVKDDSDKPVETPTLTSIAIAVAETAKTEYKVGDAFDKAGITVTATYSDSTTANVTADATITAKAGDADFTTATAGTFDVTFTATYEGQTATATRTITVKEEIPEGLTVAQKVTDETVTETGWYQTTANTSGNIVQQTAAGAISVNIKDNTCPIPEYILKDAMSGAVKITATFNITTAGNSCGIMEILDADGSALFQPARINGYNTNSGITITTKSGSDNTKKSPTIALGTDFTVETIINFGAGKFQTKVDGTPLPVQTFSGEGKALKAIKFNPKTSGTVMTISGVTVTDVAEADIPDDLKPTVFVSKTATVTNDEATLGITATEVTSDNEAVATVELAENEGIKITSVKPGVATITAKADEKTATIKVTVADDGAITTSIKKYVTPGSAEIFDVATLTETVKTGNTIYEGTNFKVVIPSSSALGTPKNATATAPYEGTTIVAADGSASEFTKGLLPNGTGGVYEITPTKDATVTIYYSSSDSAYGSNKVTASTSKGGDLKWKIGTGEAQTSTTTGNKTTLRAYEEVISVNANETLTIALSANRLVLYGIKVE